MYVQLVIELLLESCGFEESELRCQYFLYSSMHSGVYNTYKNIFILSTDNQGILSVSMDTSQKLDFLS